MSPNAITAHGVNGRRHMHASDDAYKARFADCRCFLSLWALNTGNTHWVMQKTFSHHLTLLIL